MSDLIKGEDSVLLGFSHTYLLKQFESLQILFAQASLCTTQIGPELNRSPWKRRELRRLAKNEFKNSLHIFSAPVVVEFNIITDNISLNCHLCGLQIIRCLNAYRLCLTVCKKKYATILVVKMSILHLVVAITEVHLAESSGIKAFA